MDARYTELINNIATYSPRSTPMHRVDAQIKIILLIVYSIALFVIQSWLGLALCALILGCAMYAARLQPHQVVRQFVPVLFILIVMMITSTFSFNAEEMQTSLSSSLVSGWFSNSPAVILYGSFGIAPSGFARGCFYAFRIIMLLCASVVLTSTTSSTQLADALDYFMRPLSRFHIPTRDISTIVSIALRFIPVTVDEFRRVHDAQVSRGSDFNGGSLIVRLKSWACVLIPLFVGLYRRADDLASAMDARCYGCGSHTSLNQSSIGMRSFVIFAGTTAMLVLICVFS